MGGRRSVAVSTRDFSRRNRDFVTIYFYGRPVTFNDSVISNFLSPGDNPKGYVPATLGTALADLLLAPTVMTLSQRIGWIQVGVDDRDCVLCERFADCDSDRLPGSG